MFNRVYLMHRDKLITDWFARKNVDDTVIFVTIYITVTKQVHSINDKFVSLQSGSVFYECSKLTGTQFYVFSIYKFVTTNAFNCHNTLGYIQRKWSCKTQLEQPTFNSLLTEWFHFSNVHYSDPHYSLKAHDHVSYIYRLTQTQPSMQNTSIQDISEIGANKLQQGFNVGRQKRMHLTPFDYKLFLVFE